MNEEAKLRVAEHPVYGKCSGILPVILSGRQCKKHAVNREELLRRQQGNSKEAARNQQVV
jgi:hypothetical protein